MSEFDDYYNELNLSELSQQEVAELCFEAGAQSRQAKIEELQRKYDELNNRSTGIVLDQMATAKLNYELQEGVDKVVHILTYTNHASTPLCNELREILKGNKDEK